MSPRPPWSNLTSAARMVAADPVGILLPSGALLGLQAMWIASGAAIPGGVGSWTWWLVFATIGLGRVVISAPLRWLVLRAGARQLGRPTQGWRSAASLLVVSLLAAVTEGVLLGAVLSATAAPAWWLLARGTWIGAVLLFATTAPLLLIAGVSARVGFAYAAVEASAGGVGPGEALSRGWAWTRDDLLSVVFIAAAGEVALALGGVVCGAGALPAVPLVDLAILHRWSDRIRAATSLQDVKESA